MMKENETVIFSAAQSVAATSFGVFSQQLQCVQAAGKKERVFCEIIRLLTTEKAPSLEAGNRKARML